MKEELREAGLNYNEIKVYIALLKEKKATASHVAKLVKMNRTTAYLELDNLVGRGLVSYVIRDSKRYYQPASPDKLLQILDFKREKIKSILPSLKSLSGISEPFKIEILEGKEGVKTFYQDILENAKEVLAFGVTGKAMEVLEFSYPHFLKKFVGAGIKERALANFDSEDLMRKHPRRNLKVRFLPKGFKSEVTTFIYSGKIAIQSLVRENIYVAIITDKLLYEGYKNYFEFMWNSV